MPSHAKRRIFAVASIACLLASCANKSDQSGTPSTPKGLQVGLVFDVGGRGDKSFNDAAYAGLERAQRELGVEIATIETGEGTEREAAMRQLASRGSQLIFGVGFLFSDDIRQLAREFPNTRFACVDYTVTPGESLPSNLVALKFKEEEGSFLVGALAARVTRSGKVGFVGGMEIPLIKKFEAGYRAGVAAARPGMPVLVKYAGTTASAFKDPTKGKELALAEYHQGADIIFHASGSTGLGVFEAARELKKLAIGVDSDQHDEAPDVILTSMIKRVDTAVFETIREVTGGSWSGGIKEFGLADRGVGWVYDERNQSRIPAPVKAEIDSFEKEIIAGRIKVPAS